MKKAKWFGSVSVVLVAGFALAQGGDSGSPDFLDKLSGIFQGILDFTTSKEALIVLIGGGAVDILSRLIPSTKIVSIFRQAVRILNLVVKAITGPILLLGRLLEKFAALLDKLVPDRN